MARQNKFFRSIKKKVRLFLSELFCVMPNGYYQTFTRFSGAMYNGSFGVMWNASYQASI